MEPLVSVIMPCFEARATLPRALASLVLQTYEHWECVLVDDGSTDDPRKIVDAFGDPRIRYVRLPENRGRAVTRQRALDEARGELLAMLDADDWYFPDKLERQVAFLAAEPEVAAVSSACAMTDGERLTGIRPRRVADPCVVRRFDELGPAPLPHGPAMIRMALAKSFPFDPTLYRSQDADFLITILLGRRYAVLPEPTYAYRETPEGFARKVRGSTACTMKLFWKHRHTRPLRALACVLRTVRNAAIYEVVLRLGLDTRLAARRVRPATTVEQAWFTSVTADVDEQVRRIFQSRTPIVSMQGCVTTLLAR